MPSFAVDPSTGERIELYLWWCNHPNHKEPGRTETNERWVGIHHEAEVDHGDDMVATHGRTFGWYHRPHIVSVWCGAEDGSDEDLKDTLVGFRSKT